MEEILMRSKNISLTSAIIGIALAATSISSFAGAYQAPTQNPFAGLYIGASVGVAHAGLETTAFTGNKILGMKDSGGTNNGIAGQLRAGYRYGFNHWVLGGEIFGDLSNLEQKSNSKDAVFFLSADFQTKIKYRYGFGLDLQAGYRFNNNLFYLLAGPAWTNWKFSEKDTAPAAPTLSNSVTKTRTGGIVGLGAQQALTQHLSVREQITYGWYSGFSQELNNTIFNHIKVKGIQVAHASVGLDYQFNV
jgi:opacity protein-like surface antigen